ncbi:hypothetical protein C8Q78DRAFT_1077737 [Trametes maxima]|nr:hypothetical protein C8Q78DRAFT_1077737 [Trametes maxima]
MALPFLVISRTPSLALFGTFEAGLAYFVYRQWQKPNLITGPLPSATPKGYIGSTQFEHHETQPVHVAHALPQ